MFNKKTTINTLVPNEITIHEDDRVSITLKEYESLKKELEETKILLERKEHILNDFVRPFVKANVPQEVFDKLIEGKLKTSIQEIPFIEDPLVKKYAIIFEYRGE